MDELLTQQRLAAAVISALTNVERLVDGIADYEMIAINTQSLPMP